MIGIRTEGMRAVEPARCASARGWGGAPFIQLMLLVLLALAWAVPASVQAKPGKASAAKGSSAKKTAGKGRRGGKAAPLPVEPPPTAMTVGRRWRDCPEENCPWLVEVPVGHFRMGSPLSEPDRVADESPQHTVHVGYRLGVMEHEVTRAEFAAFVEDAEYDMPAGCWVWNGTKVAFDAQRDWRQPGFTQTDQDPVVCVNWEDAQAYARWFSQFSGAEYRLPSEAEWEYVARAGSRTAFSFGEGAEVCRLSNSADQSLHEAQPDWNIAVTTCTDGVAFTAPVGRYAANAVGVYDMHGNVWEWVQDCWHSSYLGAPADGSAWSSDCNDERRIVRGGSWFDPPRFLRSASRNRAPASIRGALMGFRLVRTLKP